MMSLVALRAPLKAGLDNGACRSARQNASVELRKVKRDQDLKERRARVRARHAAEDTQMDAQAAVTTAHLPAPAQLADAQDVSPGEMADPVRLVLNVVASHGPDGGDAAQHARRALSDTPPHLLDAPTDAIPVEVIGPLVALLRAPEHMLVRAVLHCLGEIGHTGASAQREALVAADGVTGLVGVLAGGARGLPSNSCPLVAHGAASCPRKAAELGELAASALDHLSLGRPDLRDLALRAGACTHLLSFIESTAFGCSNAPHSALRPLRSATMALSTMLAGRPAPDPSYPKQAAPLLAKLLMIPDTELRAEACSCLAAVARRNEPATSAGWNGGGLRWPNRFVGSELVVGTGCVASLMSIASDGGHILTADTEEDGRMDGTFDEKSGGSPRDAALDALVSILSGPDAAAQAVIDAGVLRLLPRMLRSHCTHAREQACDALASIAAGSEAQLQLVAASSMVTMVVALLSCDVFSVRKAAAMVVSSLLRRAEGEPDTAVDARASHLVGLGTMRALAELLEVNDAATQKLVLTTISSLLEAGASIWRRRAEGVPAYGLYSGQVTLPPAQSPPACLLPEVNPTPSRHVHGLSTCGGPGGPAGFPSVGGGVIGRPTLSPRRSPASSALSNGCSSTRTGSSMRRRARCSRSTTARMSLPTRSATPPPLRLTRSGTSRQTARGAGRGRRAVTPG